MFVPIKLYAQQLLWHVMPSEISMAEVSSYYICNMAWWWPPGWLKHVADFNFWTKNKLWGRHLTVFAFEGGKWTSPSLYSEKCV
jgi:hypothetical protein